MDTLEKAMQVVIDRHIDSIRYDLENGMELEDALQKFERTTNLGSKSKAEVIAAFS